NLINDPLINGVLMNYRDITERKQAEVELARLYAQIQAKNKELEQVVYVVSHDLRSPLVNIDGYGREVEYAIAELEKALAADHASSEALRAAALPPVQEMSAALRYIRGSTTQMDALLSGLLKLSRSGRASLTIAPLNMNELVAGVVAATAFQIRKAGVELAVAELPPCRGDAVQVSQVFANLLGNALKYLDPNRPGIVRISGVVDGKRAVYCVEDNGVGIALAHQNKIFELFHRLAPSKSKGEGLGLAIVRQVVGRLEGEVRVESKPGEGSRFSVALPAVAMEIKI
ncbi:MAG: sensor histidine kinase, partial [Syntrophales bacterium]